jgi:hypothetical protein
VVAGGQPQLVEREVVVRGAGRSLHPGRS